MSRKQLLVTEPVHRCGADDQPVGALSQNIGDGSLRPVSPTAFPTRPPISPLPQYPLLEVFLTLRQMELKAAYTIREVAVLFGVSPRAIQSRVASGQIVGRDLPGRAKFLPSDLEQFIQNSDRRGRE